MFLISTQRGMAERERSYHCPLIRGTVASSKRKPHLWNKVPPVFPKGDLCFQRMLSPSSVPQPLLIMLRPIENPLIGLTSQLIRWWSLLISTSSSLLQPYHLFHWLKYAVLSLPLPLTLQCLLPITFLWPGIISLYFQISLSLLSDLYLASSKLESLFSYVLSWHPQILSTEAVITKIISCLFMFTIH